MKRPIVISLWPLALAAADPSAVDSFEKKIRPLFVSQCHACHSAETKPAGGLRVDDRAGLLRGGDSGPAVVPGDPERSLLLRRVQHADPRQRMPREGPALTPAQVDDLRAWIAQGAPWPAEAVKTSPSASASMYARLRAKHWAYQPLTAPVTPPVTRADWPRGPVDRFVLAKLEAAGLRPVRDADKLTLIRRLRYDLTGLPPAPAEIDTFLADRSPQAVERLVDRLIALPAFGERWGRHWLDVARYGESTGPSRNIPYPHAGRYRDYVIDAVQRDVPFDQFLREQIAGDLLPASTLPERDRLLIATGFLALGPKDVNQRFKERFIMDNAAEQIDTVTRATLALTVGCARCHDHKFDPIPTADYYALAGIFTSTDDAAGVRNKMGGAGLDYYDPKMLVRLATYQPPPQSDESSRLEREVAEAKKAWEAIRGTPEGLALGPNGRPKQQPFRLRFEKLQAELLERTDPASYGFAVHGARDAQVVGDTAIRLRGEAEKLGPVVPRGFLTAFAVPGAPTLNREQSGRLELAKWIAHPANPLTARVIVNRVWRHVFGRGLVSTVDNFGVTGDRPTHPELLDYLATRFIADGWSVKKLVRTLVLSRTYQLSSEAPPELRAADPQNRWLWRHAPRRLDAEEIRDTLLQAAGWLTDGPGDAAPVRALKMIELRDNGPESRAIQEQADASTRRSVYLPLLRGVTPRALEPFDPVTQTLVTGERENTTVPAQGLFFLNSSFVRRQALRLSEQLLAEPSRARRVERAYRLILGRAPLASEQARVSAFVQGFERDYRLTPVAVEEKPVAVAAKPVRAAPSPVDPDNIDRTDLPPVEETVTPRHAEQAAWMALVQSLFASAELRFVQ